MISNKSIVLGMLIKVKKGLGNFGDSGHLEDRFYILIELETEDCRYSCGSLVFYGLTEGRFFNRSHWRIERYIEDGTIDIVA